MKRWDRHRTCRDSRQRSHCYDPTTESIYAQKKTAANIVSMELLVNDWLRSEQPNPELKHYLVESLLPSLVVGLEKLLTEVGARGLVESTGHSPSFNPLNYLAQHLMRNNPKYSNFVEAHPYCRALLEVAEELKKMAYTVDNTQLSQLKSDIEKHCLAREGAESMVLLEEKRRVRVLEEACSHWLHSSEKASVEIEVQSAVRSWLELISSEPCKITLTESFSVPLSPEWSVKEGGASLVSSLLQACQKVSGELVDSLAAHLIICSSEKKSVVLKEQRRKLFSTVFDSCDPDKTGSVDRVRVIHLFNCFYNSAPDNVRDTLLHPRRWPIVEVVEDEELEDKELTSNATSPLSEEEYLEFLAGAAGDQHANQTTESLSEKMDDSATVPRITGAFDNQAPDNSAMVFEPSIDHQDKPCETQEEIKHKEHSTIIDVQQSGQGSVIAGRLATADKYGRATSISAMRRISGMSDTPVSPAGPGASWDYFSLNCSQFVQLVELFLACPDPEQSVIDSLSAFLRENYNETATERSERLALAQEQRLILARGQRVNALFESWDNDGSGYLELEELQLALGRIQGLTTEHAQEDVKDILTSVGAVQPRLSRSKFRAYIERLTKGMKQEEFEEFSGSLKNSVKLTSDEVCRGEKRKTLLHRISVMGKASGLQFLKAMDTAVESIIEDNAEFGGNKNCSVAIAMLEPSAQALTQQSLVYEAASSDIQSKTIGRKLLRSCKQGVTFKAIDTNSPLYVPDIMKHGEVYFFIPDHNNDNFNGSLVVTPVVEPSEAVVGTLSVDSLRELEDNAPDTNFQTHDISFYQGVGVCLGEVFQWIKARKKFITIAKSAVGWLYRRCPQLVQSTVYLVEPCLSHSQFSFTLRSVLTSTGTNEHSQPNKTFPPEDHLYQCVENSEPVMARVHGQYHLASPIRDDTGCAVAVLDLQLPPTHRGQAKDISKILKLLTVAFRHLNSTTEEVAAFDDSASQSDDDATVLFDQLMLSDLKQRVSKLNDRMFAEIWSCIEPSSAVLGIVKALLYMLYPDKDFNSWKNCKQAITVSLLSNLQQFDPQSVTEHCRANQVKEILSGIEIGVVQNQGSVLIKFIYSWVNVCLSLMEHSIKKHSYPQDDKQ